MAGGVIAEREQAGLPPLSEEAQKSLRDREAELVKLRFVESSLVAMVKAER
jgi:hypothetical protein